MRLRHAALLAVSSVALLPLAPGPALAQRFRAMLHEAGHERFVGVVVLDGGRHLAVVSARPGRAGLLRQLTEEVNGEQVLHLDMPPPASSPRFADVTAPVDRTDPRFVAALREHLRRYYDITLR